MHDHQVFHVVLEIRILLPEILQHGIYLIAHIVKLLFGDEAAIEDRARSVGYARRLQFHFRLAAEDRVHVDACIGASPAGSTGAAVLRLASSGFSSCVTACRKSAI